MVTATELAQEIRDEIERSTKVLRNIADMIEALDAGQVRMKEPGSWPVCITITYPLDSGTIGKPADSEEQGATQGR